MRVIEQVYRGDRTLIITRSPLRISLGGGGTDLPSYYRDHAGFVISAAIDKYVYITLHETFTQEVISSIRRWKSPRRRTKSSTPLCAKLCDWSKWARRHLEITSMSDIPAGTGLGSSGSFTTALLRALHTMKKNYISRQELAEQACHIEIDLLGEPVGKQDQYIASFGGITSFHFLPDDRVEVAPLADRRRNAA